MKIKGFVDLFVRCSAGGDEKLCDIAKAGGYGAVGFVTDSDTVFSDGLTAVPIIDVLDGEGVMSNVRTALATTGAGMIYGGRTLGGNGELLMNVMAYCSGLNCRIALVPDEAILTKGAQVSEGRASSLSGMKGFPYVAESVGIFRAVEVAREYGIKLHLHGISTKRGIELVKEAKEKGVDVTCSVVSYSLCMSEEDLINSGWDPRFKTEIPLRSDEDRKALWTAVGDGTVDAISSGHLEISDEDEMVPFPEAPFGGPELPGAAMRVLRTRRDEFADIPMEKVVRCLTSGPAGLLGLEHDGDLAEMIEDKL